MKAGGKYGWNGLAIAMLVSSCAAVFIGGCAAEPNLALRVTVTDAVTGRPIAGAKVSDDGYGTKPYRETVTDASGQYQYATWAEEHNIVAQAPGYQPQRKALPLTFLQMGKEQVLDFALSPE